MAAIGQDPPLIQWVLMTAMRTHTGPWPPARTEHIETQDRTGEIGRIHHCPHSPPASGVVQ